MTINKKTSIEELAGIVAQKLQEHQLDCVLVGGACVSIYSKNRYQSYDLDYVTYEDMGKIKRALQEIGFSLSGNMYRHPKTQFFIEFVTPPVAIGSELVKEFQDFKTPIGKIKMLTPTDCVKDRLASYYYWEDRQALDQAIMVCAKRKVDLKNIEAWSKAEGHLEKYQHFVTLLK